MSQYEVLLYLHLFGVFLLIGAAGVSTAVGVSTGRIIRTRTTAFLLDLQHLVEWFVTLPGGAITVIAGVLLVNEAGYSFGDAWISSAFVLIALALLLDFGGLIPRNRQYRRMAADLIDRGVEESDELRRAAGSPVTVALGVTLDVVFLVFLYLMIAKPGA